MQRRQQIHRYKCLCCNNRFSYKYNDIVVRDMMEHDSDISCRKCGSTDLIENG